eukprot:CAMPEP_0174700670 /NCGR_PEP_ID=MMETSP1094-20130205/5555_1 /TAXON_ID=156173 /ORGANISM="Chrysochromulina brevifilum, Strain UTEX LB 985" /LENGTH=224 /DNA_ID=CAMNT_0015898191 /DNA_START=185 /DNA_END=861 /DNA_ORIENTATION=+
MYAFDMYKSDSSAGSEPARDTVVNQVLHCWARQVEMAPQTMEAFAARPEPPHVPIAVHSQLRRGSGSAPLLLDGGYAFSNQRLMQGWVTSVTCDWHREAASGTRRRLLQPGLQTCPMTRVLALTWKAQERVTNAVVQQADGAATFALFLEGQDLGLPEVHRRRPQPFKELPGDRLADGRAMHVNVDVAQSLRCSSHRFEAHVIHLCPPVTCHLAVPVLEVDLDV